MTMPMDIAETKTCFGGAGCDCEPDTGKLMQSWNNPQGIAFVRFADGMVHQHYGEKAPITTDKEFLAMLVQVAEVVGFRKPGGKPFEARTLGVNWMQGVGYIAGRPLQRQPRRTEASDGKEAARHPVFPLHAESFNALRPQVETRLVETPVITREMVDERTAAIRKRIGELFNNHLSNGEIADRMKMPAAEVDAHIHWMLDQPFRPPLATGNATAAKFTDEQVYAIRDEYAAGNATLTSLAKKYGVHKKTIRDAVLGERAYRNVKHLV